MASDWLHQGPSYEEQGDASATMEGDDVNSYGDVVLEKVEDSTDDVDVSKGKAIAIIIGIVIGLVIMIALTIVIMTKKSSSRKEVPVEETSEVIDTSEDEWVSAPTSFYTEEDRELLRKWGFSGEEIQSYEEQQVPANDLVEKTKKDQIEAQQEVLNALDNKKSKAYKKLIANTWLELDPVTGTFSSDPTDYAEFEAVDNADYSKVPARGNQFWLRITLSDKTVIFMPVSPYEYASKEKSGNINIRYRYFLCNEVKYISYIEEIQIE